MSIITDFVYQLSHELQNDLRFGKLQNIKKQNYVRSQSNAQLPYRK